MLRGTRTFVCDECGHKFKGMDIEWMATAFSQPLKCPMCGSWHTCPPSLFGWNKRIYKDIWKSLDERNVKNKESEVGDV